MKLLLLLLLLPSLAQARVTQFSLDLKRMPFQRDFMFPEQLNWGNEVKLTANGELGYYFQNNQVTGRTYNSRFRYVSWEFDHGFHLAPWLDLIHSHKSEHAMDRYLDKYPVRDSYGFRISFLEGGK